MAVVELPEAAATEKAGLAVALRRMVCGEPGASSVMIKFALPWPEAVGLKTREMEQLAAGARGAVQVLEAANSAELDPATEIEETCSGAFPEFTAVSVWGALDAPCVVAGNDGAGGERLRAGSTAMPVPLRATVCGEPWASSAIVRPAVRWPGAVGLKTTEMAQLALGAIAAAQLLVKLKSEGLGPVRDTEEMWRVVLPELVTVKD